ncbi:MAG: hypothetical protein JNK02_14220 [Planctomycetes bacterium]|nr:hypothetical protein [Planctomycetota bacterium]
MRPHSFLAGLAVCGLAAPAFAGRLIAVDSSRALYEIDPLTGAKTSIGTVSANAGTTGGLAHDPVTGTLYLTSTSTDSLYTLDLSTGTATLVGFYGDAALVMHGIEWDASTSTLYGGSNGGLYTINTSTGLATLVGSTGTTSFLNLVHDTSTNTLYGTSSSTDSFYQIDRVTGAGTLIGPLGPGSTNPNGLAYDPVVNVIYAVDNSTDNLLTIDRTTGFATVVGSTGAGNLLGLVYLPDTSAATAFCFGDGAGAACPCANNGAAGNGCASSVNPNGGNLGATGSASIGADTFTLVGTGMPNSSALYFQGTSQLGGGLGVAFGDGLRCAGGSIIRLGTKNNVGGASQYPAAGDVAISIRGLNSVGDVRTYQVWYRNAAAFCTPSTFNLTNGLQTTWIP